MAPPTRRLGLRQLGDGFDSNAEMMAAAHKAVSLKGFAFVDEGFDPPTLAKALLGKWAINYETVPACSYFSDEHLVRFLRLLVSARIDTVERIEERLVREGGREQPKPGDAGFYGMIFDWLSCEGVIDILGNMCRKDVSMDTSAVSRVDAASLKDLLETYAVARDVFCRANPATKISGRKIMYDAMDDFIKAVKCLQNVDQASALVFAPLEEAAALEEADEEDDKDESEDSLVLNKPIPFPHAHPPQANAEATNDEQEESLFVSSDNDVRDDVVTASQHSETSLDSSNEDDLNEMGLDDIGGDDVDAAEREDIRRLKMLIRDGVKKKKRIAEQIERNLKQVADIMAATDRLREEADQHEVVLRGYTKRRRQMRRSQGRSHPSQQAAAQHEGVESSP